MAKQSRIAHLTNEQLANMTAKDVAIAYYNGNIGAGYNALVARGIKPLAQAQEPGKNAATAIKTVAARVATLAPVKAPVSPVLPLPARIEEWLADNILPAEWQDNDGRLTREIPQHFVELVVISDTPDWNKRIRRLGQDEIAMLEAFLGDACTMNRREDAMLEKRARAPFERAQARMDAQARIDAALATAESRFENSRYDATIVAAYLEGGDYT